ncbi:MAG: hypothetical protein J7J91_08770 [Deltaproteobacteria bacterium]|nr:hypothetical protein [Deltaproteobacteria bacterium]
MARISRERFARMLEERGIPPTYARWYLWLRASREIVNLYNDVIRQIAAVLKAPQVSAERELERFYRAQEPLVRRWEEIRRNLRTKWKILNWTVINPLDIKRVDRRTWRILDETYIPDYDTVFTEMIDYIRERLREKDRIIASKLVKLEYIGVDAETGNDIYYDAARKEYVVRDERGVEIERGDTLELDYTYSIETHTSHGKPVEFYAEITGKTFVKGKGRKGVEEVEKGIQRTLREWVKENFDKEKIEKARKEGRTVPPEALLFEKMVIKEGVEYRLGRGREGWVEFTFEKTKERPWKKEVRLRLVS